MKGRKPKDSSSSADDFVKIHMPFEDAEPGSPEVPLAELDEFIVPGSDEKGSKVTITFNVPPLLDRQIEVILNSRRFPYVNKKDFFRHAALRHIGWLLDIRMTVPKHFFYFTQTVDEMVRDDEAGMKMEQVFNILHDRLNDHMDRGENGEALRLVSLINQRLKEMRPGTWIKRFSERFFSKYGSWLYSPGSNPKPKTKLIDSPGEKK